MGMVPGFLAGLHGTAKGSDPHVVVQDIDATIDINASIDHGLDLIGFGDIGFVNTALAALLLDNLKRFFYCSEIDVYGKNLCALPSKQNGCRFTVAPSRSNRSGAGYDGHLIFQTFLHTVYSLFFFIGYVKKNIFNASSFFYTRFSIYNTEEISKIDGLSVPGWPVGFPAGSAFSLQEVHLTQGSGCFFHCKMPGCCLPSLTAATALHFTAGLLKHSLQQELTPCFAFLGGNRPLPHRSSGAIILP
jgi:hypothetical protein